MRSLLCALAIVAAIPAAANADIIRYEFSGLSWADESPLTGSFSYDLAAPDTDLRPDVGHYDQDGFDFVITHNGIEYATRHFSVGVYAPEGFRKDWLTTDNGFQLAVELGLGVDKNGQRCFIASSDSLISGCQPAYAQTWDDPGQGPFGVFIVNQASWRVAQPIPVPEPSSLLLMGAAIASGLAWRRWRGRRATRRP
jgi:hypothetical protein